MVNGLETFTQKCAPQEDSCWAANEVGQQSMCSGKAAAADGVQGSQPARRIFPAGTTITDAMINSAGIANDPQALNLSKNLLFRDYNPKAFFTTPGLEATIDRLTCTQGDSTDPRNLARNMELTGPDLKNLTVLQNHEGAAKIAQWRAANQDQMTDTPFPPHLTPEQVAAETDKTHLQTAINDFLAEKGQPFLLEPNIQKYASMQAYRPDPNFDGEASLSDDADKQYLKLLVERRQSLE